MAYQNIQPFGVERDDFHHARTQAVITNCFQNLMFAQRLTRSRRNFSVRDFIHKPPSSEKDRIAKFTQFLNSKVKND